MSEDAKGCRMNAQDAKIEFPVQAFDTESQDTS